MDHTDTPECLDNYNALTTTCHGPVEYYDVSGSGRAFPRCTFHLEAALERDQATRERYPQHAPSDFDPDYAGERWDDDY
jgi:hypothetical protein